jgi:hypothetical protein
MTSELGDAEDKYRKKIDEEDDLILSSTDIRDINDGKTVIKTIPVKANPTISYNGLGGNGEGDGDGDNGDGNGKGNNGEGGKGDNSKVKVGVDKRRLKQMMENWGLSFSKPGKKDKKLYKLLTTENGVDENQEKTIEAMLDRQMATGYFEKNGFKIDVRDEDMRYNFIEEKLIPNLSATFVIMRDISGSMDTYGEFSATIAGLIEFWLKQKYEDTVKIRYLAHTNQAFEFDPRKKDDFYKLVANGGTSFQPAYKLVMDMTDGIAYPSMSPYKERIAYESEDVFLLHITDGDNYEDNGELYNTLKKLFPRLTKVFYLQVGSDSDEFYKMIKSVDRDKVNEVKSGNDISYGNVKKVLDSLLN